MEVKKKMPSNILTAH